MCHMNYKFFTDQKMNGRSCCFGFGFRELVIFLKNYFIRMMSWMFESVGFSLAWFWEVSERGAAQTCRTSVMWPLIQFSLFHRNPHSHLGRVRRSLDTRGWRLRNASLLYLKTAIEIREKEGGRKKGKNTTLLFFGCCPLITKTCCWLIACIWFLKTLHRITHYYAFCIS